MIIVYILLSVFFIMILTSFILYLIVFYSPHKNQNNIYQMPKETEIVKQYDNIINKIKILNSIPFEKVSIKSFDNLNLYANYYEKDITKPIVILLHGYRSTNIRDFCGGSKICFSLNYNVLLINQRSHGISEGHTITFGINEYQDCLSWIKYVRQRFNQDKKIILCGISMGATTALLASEHDVNKDISGLIIDSPYISPKDIICKVIKNKKLNPKLVYPFIHLGARLFGHFNSNKGNVMNDIKNLTIPTLIVHGESDNLVPPTMSEEISNLNKELITRVTFKESGHGLSYIVHEDEYFQLVQSFLDKIH